MINEMNKLQYKEGDLVHVNINLIYNGKQLHDYVFEVTRIEDNVLFLNIKGGGFRLAAHKDDCERLGNNVDMVNTAYKPSNV